MAQIAVTDKGSERKDSYADDGKQAESIAVTDEDGEREDSVTLTDDASTVVISNASSNCQAVNEEVTSTKHETVSTDVKERIGQQPTQCHPAPTRQVPPASSLHSLGPTRQVPLASPIPSLVNALRNSAVTAMKRTRQTLSEKLGRGTKTVDVELDSRIESLRLLQIRYSTLLQLARSFNCHFSALVNCQQSLAAEFSNLSQKMPELHDEFAYNAETQRALFKNGETLVGTLNFFISTVHTLCSKTIEDTLDTVKQYEDARLEFDAYRSDVESNSVSKSPELQQSYEQHRNKFEQLRQILDIKLKFLDENKVKVMHQQLVLFHNAIAAYFAGNQAALDETVKQFNIKLKSPNGGIPSWLENQD